MTDKKPASSAELKLIADLAALLRESGLSEIELERAGLRVRVAAAPAHAAGAPVYMPAPTQTQAPPAPGGGAQNAQAHPGAVLSPMVGTAYLSPEPGSASFVKVGDNVADGQTLMIVEAMKTFNPIVAPRAGKLVELLVTNGQPVEFGQALAILE